MSAKKKYESFYINAKGVRKITDRAHVKRYEAKNRFRPKNKRGMYYDKKYGKMVNEKQYKETLRSMIRFRREQEMIRKMQKQNPDLKFSEGREMMREHRKEFYDKWDPKIKKYQKKHGLTRRQALRDMRRKGIITDSARLPSEWMPEEHDT